VSDLPERLVEAAAMALRQSSLDENGLSSPPWEDADAEYQDYWRKRARVALAAVIPMIEAREREACALVALNSPIPDDCGVAEAHGRNVQALGIAAAIRERGES
jgi:hypothetical protein